MKSCRVRRALGVRVDEMQEQWVMQVMRLKGVGECAWNGVFIKDVVRR
jgi:hypothetical protein